LKSKFDYFIKGCTLLAEMKYISFTVENYKGIEQPLTLNVDKNSLIPIIGVNECGKTTILQAIFGFDFYNDTLNKNVRHLNDIRNRYKSNPSDPKITAEIEISREEITDDIFKELANIAPEQKEFYRKKFGKDYSGTVKITRNLITKKYSIDPYPKDAEVGHEIAHEIVSKLPFTLFFDDFRDSIENEIEIKANSNGKPDGWLAIVDRLFNETDPTYSILDLPNKEERDRKGIISNVNRTLEKVLTKEWKNFRLEDRDDALKIKLDYTAESEADGSVRHFVKFDVVEQDASGQEYFFYIQDRSKGFFWFFNFVMKLEFNPKVHDDEKGAIYLLDEPGSYLHALAQIKLCNKLRSLSKDNKIIFCTHSHYLLDPEIIPINSIRVANKDPDTLQVSLKSIHDFNGLITDKKSAFQPITDALHIKPFALETGTKKTVIVEGIYDYYCFEMFKSDSDLTFMPGTSADSIKYLVSLMIGWDIPFNVIFDGDAEGQSRLIEAKKFFGDEETKKFISLDPPKILQNLFAGEDMIMIRTELSITSKSSFEKTILTLFYSEKRDEILGKISDETRTNFNTLLDLVK
jgi:energy-coupling factor transporter ATP-binding protein EcfA2